jgi:hypothetical protein
MSTCRKGERKCGAVDFATMFVVRKASYDVIRAG